jgi:histidinol-phosphate/aromatic aminotransferase/cobyric acid decarboxylase-like protein
MKHRKLDILRVPNTPRPNKHLADAGERSGFPDGFIDGFTGTLVTDDFTRYPNIDALKQRLAAKHNVSSKNIFIGAGSDICLQILFQVFVEKDNVVLMPEAHFPMYDVYIQQQMGRSKLMRYRPDLSLDVDTDVDGDLRLVIVGNPNSPVGDVLSTQDFARLLQYTVPVVVDEAYAEFGATPLPVSLINQNVIFTRTFSKAWGAAGARIGYVIANEYIIDLMGKFRQMFEITGVSSKFAHYLLDHEEVMKAYVAEIVAERERFKDTGIAVKYGNWIHLPQERYLNLTNVFHVKQNVTLPQVNPFLLRITLFKGLYEATQELHLHH